jgi:uncharacterized protein YbjT (DUF2867 family)
MSEPLKIALVGATGLVGRYVIDACIGRNDIRLIGISRREVDLPQGARMEMIVADPEGWGDVIAAVAPTVLISALGTTIKQVGGDHEAFRAVDQHLLLNTARAAQAAGVRQMVSVSSVGADARSKNFYLRVKGEVDQELSTIGFKRLDILRPGLLRGKRVDDARFAEGLAQVISPVIDPFLRGKWRAYHSIGGDTVARGALGLAARKAPGRFTHDYDGICRAAREWNKHGV